MKIILLYNSENTMFKDFSLIKNENIIVRDYYISISRKYKLIKAVRTFLCSNKVNSIVKIPFKHIWSSLNYINWDKRDKYIIIFCGIYNKHLELKYLLSLKKQYNIEYAIVLFDILSSPHSEVSQYYIDNLRFKYIFTFDPIDEEKNKYYHIDTYYSMINKKNNNTEVEYDLYYIGRNECERLTILKKLCELMNKNDVSSKLRLHGVSQKEKVYRDKIIYNKFIQYDEVIKETLKTNCILEILSHGQTGATLRYYEAVCYNKKLLTNNKNVVNLPFYNPNYIHIFEKPNDIDWNWVKEQISIDYHYDGRFSPTRFIDRIIELNS